MTMEESEKKQRIAVLTRRIQNNKEFISTFKKVIRLLSEKDGCVINHTLETWLCGKDIDNVKIYSAKGSGCGVPIMVVSSKGNYYDRQRCSVPLHKKVANTVRDLRSVFRLDSDWVAGEIKSLVNCIEKTIAEYQDCIDNFDEYIAYGERLITDLKHYQEVVPYYVRFEIPTIWPRLHSI